MNNTNSLKNKNILLGITGSVAAYKSAELIRFLKKAGANVRVMMTEHANYFITPMTLQTLSGHRVLQTLMDLEQEATMSHIDIARWANLVLVAPASAHFIAKLAHGFADDLLSTTCLATQAPIAVVPAMNTIMWLNSATQANVIKLTQRNIHIIGPDSGLQACGEIGEGRMVEPENITREVTSIFQVGKRLLGKRFLVTAGPTHEAIDPVRYISNPSSGKMGYAIAEAAMNEGAEVILISGPTWLPISGGIKKIEVISAQQMLDAVMHHVHNCDVLVAAAAVSDYRMVQVSNKKIKKDKETLQLELIRNPDILLEVSKLNRRPVIIGFAAETENLIENAKRKLYEKNLDMIVANLVSSEKGFQSDYNEMISMSSENNQIKSFSYAHKKQLAKSLIEEIINHYFQKKILA